MQILDRIMQARRPLLVGFLILSVSLVFVTPLIATVSARGLEQIPTGSVPTVTGTPYGSYITVNNDNGPMINLREYPDPLAPIVGVLLANQKVPAKGQARGYYLVEVPGIPGGEAWVYANLVTPYGNIPEVEPPATATPLYTSTIDPTLAAQFLVTLAPTRLPTFTEPAPLAIPTYPTQANGGQASSGGIPMGMIIVGIGALGILLAFISLVRGH